MLGLRADDKWACPEFAEWVSRQNGKGGIGEGRVLAGFFIVGEKLMLWSAHEVKTALEAFRRVEDLLYGLGRPGGKNLIIVEDMPVQVRDKAGRLVTELRDVPIKVSNTNGKESFERLDTRQRLMFIARSKGSGRGFSGDLNVIDEAFAYTLEQQAALMPTLSARRNPQLVYLSSPPLDGISGTVMFNLRARAEAGGDEGLGYRDWGLGGDLSNLGDIDLGDRRNWERSNPALGGRISEESVAREFRSMSAEDFARERLGVWPKRIVSGPGVIDPELWRDLATTAEDAGRPPVLVMAVVVESDRRHSAIVAVGAQGDGRIQASTVAYESGTEWVVPRMVYLRERWSPALWVVEDKGATASLWPEMERAGFKAAEDREEPKRGDVVVPWAHEVAAAYGMFIDHLTQRKLAHLGDSALDGAVRIADTRPLGSGTTWDHRLQIAALRGATNGLGAWVSFADKVMAVRDELGIW